MKILEKFSSSKAAAFFLLLFTMGYVIASRVPTLTETTWNVDETVESIVANDIARGKIIYRDTITHRAPLQHFLLSILFRMTGGLNMTAVHAALAVFILYTAAMLYLTGKLIRGRLAGALAGLVFVIMISNLPSFDTLAFHTEFVLAAFSSTAAYLLLRGVLNAGGPAWFLGSGVCLGLAFFAKQPGLLESGGLGLPLLLRALSKERRSFYLKAFCLLLAGFTTVCLCFASYFLLHGAFGDFLYYFWTYNTDIYVGILPPGERFAAILKLFTSPILKVIAPFLTFCLAVYPVYFFLRYRSAGAFERFSLTLLLSWLVFAFAATTISGRNFGHYYIEPLVPASLIGSLFILGILNAAAGRNAKTRPAGIAAACVLCAALCTGLFFPWRYEHKWIYKKREAELAEVGHYIRENSAPGDTIFVWGFTPIVYLFSGRAPASRFNQTNFLTGLVPWVNYAKRFDTTPQIVPGAWHLLMEDLEKNRPAFVADMSPGNYAGYKKYPVENFPALDRFLEAHYSKDRLFTKDDGKPLVQLWRRRDQAFHGGSDN